MASWWTRPELQRDRAAFAEVCRGRQDAMARTATSYRSLADERPAPRRRRRTGLEEEG